MKLAKVLWFILFGLVTGILWSIAGVVFCVSLIGIPFGRQCFKLAKLCFFPLGTAVDTEFDSYSIPNFLFLIFGGGFVGAVINYVIGFALCITIIFIPFGKQFLKMGRLAWAPFGGRVFK